MASLLRIAVKQLNSSMFILVILNFLHFLANQIAKKLKIKTPVSFSATSVVEVLKQLTTLDQSASASNGSIPTKVIKYCARFFALILTKLFNFCIKQAVVKNYWKHQCQ